ncbi:MAG: proton-conducting transporter membrane subunit [Nitrosomonas sp.]|nr:proton-conducting transporter membrane subunit [Nitrosomonas sp.]
MFLWTGLNALFLSTDIFNLYVTLELIGLAAVALTALAGSSDALISAMRYLLISLLGSLCYLLGVALLYHTHATVDIALLAARISSHPVTPTILIASALITTGLLLKSALFPLHFWLPPAHSSAAAPVSALLSALVIKASFYLLLRLWLELFHPIHTLMPDVLGWLGGAAILWGSLQALRQVRLKLLIAYSTVAQLGYFFLVFPLANGQDDMVSSSVWQGALYMLLAHALAKSAMFLAAGNIQLFGGHDRILLLDRIAQRLPLTLAAFSLAGISIMGLPPSGGFTGKWLLLEATIAQERWGYATVIVLGGILAAGYIFKVIGHAFTQAQTEEAIPETRPVPALMEWSALALASGSILLGWYPALLLEWLAIGNPFEFLPSSP